MAWTGDQGSAVAQTDFPQRVERIAEGAPASEKPQHDDRGPIDRFQQFAAGGCRVIRLAFQGHRIEGVDAHRVAPRHAHQRAFGGEDVRIGGGDQYD